MHPYLFLFGVVGSVSFFFFQAEDGIRDDLGTGVQTCALPISELAYRDVREAVDWLTRAFGFRERLQIGDHRAQLVYENGAVIVIQRDDPAPTNVLVRVPDAAAHHEQAAAADATILSEPTDFPYGERQYSAQDPGG